MKIIKFIKILTVSSLCAASLYLCSCASNPGNSAEIKEFRSKVDSLCDGIISVNNKMNSIDTSAENYVNELTTDLEELNVLFKDFSEIDFPADYDYLENLADEATEYMDVAASSYKKAFESNLSEEDFTKLYDYAGENYSRAYKRINVILTFLRGETPEGVKTEAVEE